VSSGDVVAVPTNGHDPGLHDDALDSPHHDAAGSGDAPADPTETAPEMAAVALPTVTPAQVIAGFGVIAAVALLILGRRRGRD